MYYYRCMVARALLRLGLVTVTVAILAGCLSTDTSVTLRSDGSGTVELTYRIARSAWDTGVFDDSDVARPIPVARGEFEEAAVQIEGLELISHRVSETDESVTVDARLDFDAPDALRRLLGAETLDITTGPDGGSWRQVVAAGRGSRGASASALARDLEPFTMTFILDPPGAVTATNGEMLRGGEAARFSIPLSDVVTASREIVWEVRW